MSLSASLASARALIEVKTMKIAAIKVRTTHRIIMISLGNDSKPMYDLTRPAAFDVGIMADIQLRLPS